MLASRVPIAVPIAWSLGRAGEFERMACLGHCKFDPGGG